MSKRTKIAILGLGLAIFTYLVFDFGISNIVINIKKTGWWFVPIIAIWAVMYMFNAGAWYTILGEETKHVRFRTLYALTVSGFALNYVTPLVNLGGEPYRILALKDQIGIRRSTSSVILDNMVRMLSHFFFWMAAVILVFLFIPRSTEFTVVLSFVSVVVLLLIFFFFSRHKRGIFASLMRLCSAHRILHLFARMLERREEALLEVDDQIKHLYNGRKPAFYRALLFEFIARIIGSLEFYFIFLAVGIQLSFFHALYINAASSLILNLFFFMPFELGTREGGLYLVMDSLRYPPGIGIFMGLANRVRELFWVLVGLILVQISGRHSALDRAQGFLKATPHESTPV
jgi:uncharacterized membrane protein YbhN (UPF0104 family)